MMRRLLLLPVLLALLPPLLPSRAAAGEAPLRIGVVPFYAPDRIHQLYNPFVGHLSRATGEVWELAVYPDHEALVRAVAGGEVAAAFLGPVPAARVMKRARIRPLAVALSEDGLPRYRSVVASTDPSVRGLADLRGKSFGYFRGSTAAHAVPLSLLEEARVPRDSLRLVPYSGQDAIVQALLAREVAAAGIKESLFRRFAASGLSRIALSPYLPNFAFYATPSLPPRAEKKLLSALLSLAPREGKGDSRTAAWDDEVRFGFVRPPKGYAASVEAVGALFEKYGK